MCKPSPLRAPEPLRTAIEPLGPVPLRRQIARRATAAVPSAVFIATVVFSHLQPVGGIRLLFSNRHPAPAQISVVLPAKDLPQLFPPELHNFPKAPPDIYPAAKFLFSERWSPVSSRSSFLRLVNFFPLSWWWSSVGIQVV